MKVSRGVLQGEVLSPLLFSLFIRDFEDFFTSKGLTGISIISKQESIIMGHADDNVILADSPMDLNSKLETLREYCNTNQLIVNTQKKCSNFFKIDPNCQVGLPLIIFLKKTINRNK